MSPSTVSENGVVGQATSFDLTLNGKTPYTYTQTFGNICSVDINDNIATVTITPTEIGTLTGSITFNEEATCNITIDVSEPEPEPTGWSVSPDKVTQTKGNQRCYTNIKKNGVNIDFNNIPTSRLTCNYVKNIATGEIIARGSDYQAKSVTSGDVAMLVRQGGSDGNICFTGYTDEIPDGEYIIKFTYTPPTSVDPESTPRELYVTFVMQTTEPEPEPEPEPTEYSLTPTTVNDSQVVNTDKDYELTLSVGSDFTGGDVTYSGDKYGGVSLESTISSAGAIFVNYNANEGDVTEVFTVTVTCHRTGGLSDIVLTSTFTIECLAE